MSFANAAVTRGQDASDLEHEARQLGAASVYVSVRLPVDAIPILVELARAEWDRRNQAHRIKVARGES